MPNTVRVHDDELEPAETPWRHRVYTIVFESDTAAGKAFDVALLIAITLSVVVVMLESVRAVDQRYGWWLRMVEAIFTALFTAEYIARLVSVRSPWRYARSFFGVIDLLAILPGYAQLFTGTNYGMVVRVLRLLRIFRILKLTHFLKESDILMRALQASRRKILVFIFAVLTMVTIMGTVMFLVEGEEHGFDSIPRGVYWAIVTLTTVGYGDIAPQTTLGRFIASIIMIMGYGIIAVPTGIFSLELREATRGSEARLCPNCETLETDAAARFCRRCGSRLPARVDAPTESNTG